MIGLPKGVKPNSKKCKDCQHLKYIGVPPVKGCNIAGKVPYKLSCCPLSKSSTVVNSTVQTDLSNKWEDLNTQAAFKE